MSVLLNTLQLSDLLKDKLVESGAYSATLMKLLDVKQATNPNNVSWAVDGYGTVVANNYAEGADFSTFNADSQIKPYLNYARFETSMKLSGSAVRQAGLTVSPRANAQLIEHQLNKAIKVVTNAIGVQSHTGLGTVNTLSGLGIGVDAASDYANISRASHPEFASVEHDAGGDALTIPDLRKLVLDLMQRNHGPAGKPDFLLCSIATFGKILSFADANFQVRYDEGLRSQARGFNLGFDYVTVMGIPLIADPHCPEGIIHGLRKDAVHYEYVPAQDNDLTGYRMVSASDSLGSKMGLPMMLIPHGKGGDNTKFSVCAELALVVTEPFKCGKITNFTI